MSNEILLSIVIPTYNRAKSLKSCLISIEQQKVDKNCYEVIVVDNGSTDNTKHIVDSFLSKFNLIYSFSPTPGLHIGRHKGLELSAAKVISFIDDDIIAFPGWIESVISAFNKPEVVMVGGNNIPKYEAPPPLWLTQWWSEKNSTGSFLPLLSILDFGEGEFDIDPGYIWGCNFSVRKEIVVKANGFHPDALPIDRIRFRGDGETHISNYVRENKLRALFNSKVSVYHCVPKERLSKEYFKKRAYAEGITDSYSLIRKNKKNLFFIYKVRILIVLFVRAAKYYLSFSNSKELNEVKMNIYRAKLSGFTFHQRECKKDIELLNWVMKDNYLE